MVKTRPEVSKKNKYWISKHRYYELNHFCLQYPEWKKAHRSLTASMRQSGSIIKPAKTTGHADPTAKCAEQAAYYLARMELVENAAKETSATLSKYIFLSVTRGLNYDYLKTRLDIPCDKDTYYELRRRFFWLLDQTRE